MDNNTSIRERKDGIGAALKKTIHGSFWTRTRGFKRLCKWAFKTCDTSDSGEVSKGELYTGLLMVYLKIAKYAGPAACYPPTREVVETLFDTCDVDQSGLVNEDEFVMIMVVLTSQLTWRILTFYALIIMLVPYIIMWTLQLLDTVGADDSFLRLDRFLETYAPFPINYIVVLVPDSVWSKLPESIVSCAILSFALPYCWDTMDDYFQGVAEKKTAIDISEELKID